MPKHFTTKTDDQLLWPEFVHSTDAKNLLSQVGRRVTDYGNDMEYLKLHLAQAEYKKLFARYRQFKHRRANDLVTFKVPRSTIERLTNYAFEIGYPHSKNPSVVDILHFLSDPIEMYEAQEDIQKVAEKIQSPH